MRGFTADDTLLISPVLQCHSISALCWSFYNWLLAPVSDWLLFQIIMIHITFFLTCICLLLSTFACSPFCWRRCHRFPLPQTSAHLSSLFRLLFNQWREADKLTASFTRAGRKSDCVSDWFSSKYFQLHQLRVNVLRLHIVPLHWRKSSVTISVHLLSVGDPMSVVGSCVHK